MPFEQTDLAFQAHSATSKAAAVGYADKAPNARLRVYTLIQRWSDGLTDEEIQNVLSMNPSSQRPRRIELEQAGLVKDSGRTRKTRSGMRAAIWVATDKAYPEPWPSKRKGAQ
jgi:hypothetical protein